MISRLKQGAAVLSGISLMALLFPAGIYLGGAAGSALNLFSAVAGKFFPGGRRFLAPLVLAANTMLSAYGVLAGGPAAWAVTVAVLSLFSWNADRFGQRWKEVPRSVQFRYLKRLGCLSAAGWGSGWSAQAWQGSFSIPFLPALLVMLAGGVLFLRLISPGDRPLGE